MSKQKILANIKKNRGEQVQREVFLVEHSQYENPLRVFIDSVIMAGAEVIENQDQKIEEYFNDEPLVVLKAQIAVAENGACYIKHSPNDERKRYTFFENIAIVVDQKDIVHTMAEAYEQITLDDFGIFISGPSKTADIEQSLVIGAHGAKVTKIFIEGN